MAQVLNEFDFKAGRAAGHEKYPWTEWFDGQIWKLDPQVQNGDGSVSGDFPGVAEDFRTTCYSAAVRHKVKVSTSVQSDGSLVLQQKGERKTA